MRISKLELFPWVAPQPQTTKLQGILNESIQIGVVPLGPQPQTTKLQGILNEYIQIGVVPLGCSPTPNYKTTENFE